MTVGANITPRYYPAGRSRPGDALASHVLRERISDLEGGISRRTQTLPFGISEIDEHLPGAARHLGHCMSSPAQEQAPSMDCRDPLYSWDRVAHQG